MKRLVYIISTFLILTGMYGGSVGAKNHDTDDEKIWCATRDFSGRVSRSTCDSKRGNIFSTESQADAEFDRLNARVVISTASSSSSGKVWCGTKKEVLRVSKYVCEFNRGGKAFDTQSEATAFHKKLKGSSSSYSSTASSSGKVWCATKYSVANISKTACKNKHHLASKSMGWI